MIHDPTAIYLADFGLPVILHTQQGDREIRAIYDDGFFDASVGETVLDTTQKRLTAKDDDLCGFTREDTLTFGERSFSVIRIMPDGTGFSTILLSADD